MTHPLQPQLPAWGWRREGYRLTLLVSQVGWKRELEAGSFILEAQNG